jgi:hypothetical protein
MSQQRRLTAVCAVRISAEADQLRAELQDITDLPANRLVERNIIPLAPVPAPLRRKAIGAILQEAACGQSVSLIRVLGLAIAQMSLSTLRRDGEVSHL